MADDGLLLGVSTPDVAPPGGGLLFDPARTTTGILLLTGDTQARGINGLQGLAQGVDVVADGHTVTVKIDAFTSGFSMWVGLGNHTANINPGTWAGDDIHRFGFYINNGELWRPNGVGGNSNVPGTGIIATSLDLIHMTPNVGAGTCSVQVNGGTPWVVDFIPTGPLYVTVGFDNDPTNQASIPSYV